MLYCLRGLLGLVLCRSWSALSWKFESGVGSLILILSFSRYILASFYTKYDPTHFLINTGSLLSVLLPKLPQFHGVRIFGINKYWYDWLCLDDWFYELLITGPVAGGEFLFKLYEGSTSEFWLHSCCHCGLKQMQPNALLTEVCLWLGCSKSAFLIYFIVSLTFFL